jgi:hypothetical protein
LLRARSGTVISKLGCLTIVASGVDDLGTTVVEAGDRLVAMIQFARAAASPTG